MYSSQRVRFPNGRGEMLAGIADRPAHGPHRFWSLFAHCFTCTKDLKAIARISRHLAGQGIATLRFDFTGLGDSEGSFPATDFRTNVLDCVAAARWMEQELEPPRLLIGHSLGGAALVVAAPQLASAQAVVNLASPSATGHLADFLERSNPAIVDHGEGAVTIGGREHTITREMVEVLRRTDLPGALKDLKLPLLVLFPERDETLPMGHGLEAFRLVGGPASFVTIDGADHLLVRNPDDPAFVGDLIAAWSRRYCGPVAES